MIKPDIWYVSYRPKNPLQSGEGHYTRTTKTFQSEREAKIFAAEVLAEGWSAIAGTLNPHEPKIIIGPSQVENWAKWGGGM